MRINSEDPLELLRDIKAKVEGISVEDVQFRDLRKKKRKNNKKSDESESNCGKITNDEGFFIVNDEAESVSYAEIAKKRRSWKAKDSLEEWGAFDFFEYACKLYINKYNIPWDLKRGGNSLEINKIRDKMTDVLGFCSNLVMRDYIVYFFNSHIDFFKDNYGDFYFRQMNSENIIQSFLDNYDYKKRFTDYVSCEKHQDKNKEEITLKEIKGSFSLGDITLVSNYGIVISLNWLIQKQKMTKKKAVMLVLNVCKDMHKRGMLSVIKKSTEFYSPYSSSFIFKDPQLIIDKVDENVKINVEFNDNNKMSFL